MKLAMEVGVQFSSFSGVAPDAAAPAAVGDVEPLLVYPRLKKKIIAD